MPQRLTDAAITKQLKTVAAQLAGPRGKGKGRLALLRRQAQLGDLRDTAERNARRASDERRGR